MHRVRRSCSWPLVSPAFARPGASLGAASRHESSIDKGRRRSLAIEVGRGVCAVLDREGMQHGEGTVAMYSKYRAATEASAALRRAVQRAIASLDQICERKIAVG